jgi:hypothetical protein
VPTLVVHGRRDRFFPVGNGEALAREIPGARLLVLDQAWTTALAAGAGLTSLALMVDSGRAQIAGFAAIAVVVGGAFALPRLVHSRIQQDASWIQQDP